MTTFKTFWKIAYQHKWGTLGFLGVSIGLIMLIIMIGGNAADEFEPVTLPVGIVNRDIHDPITQGLIQHLEGIYDLVDIEDDETAMQDALFFFEAAYVVVIPEWFGTNFVQNNNPGIQSLSRPDSAGATFIDNSIEAYFSMLRAFLDAGFDVPAAVNATQQNFTTNQITVAIAQFEESEITINPAFFNFMPFTITSVAIMLLAPVLMVFKRKELASRMAISGTASSERNLWIIVAGVVSMVGLWAVFMAFGYRFIAESPNGFLLAANAGAFLLVAAAIAFLLGQFIKKTSVLAAAAQVVALTLSFISGAFMPQEMMGDTLLMVGRLTPAYWYIRTIDVLNQPGGAFEMTELMQGIGIQVAFAAAILAVALVMGKERAKAQ